MVEQVQQQVLQQVQWLILEVEAVLLELIIHSHKHQAEQVVAVIILEVEHQLQVQLIQAEVELVVQQVDQE